MTAMDDFVGFATLNGSFLPLLVGLIVSVSYLIAVLVCGEKDR